MKSAEIETCSGSSERKETSPTREVRKAFSEKMGKKLLKLNLQPKKKSSRETREDAEASMLPLLVSLLSFLLGPPRPHGKKQVPKQEALGWAEKNMVISSKPHF